jgi:dethiobiotin synthetase
LRLAGWVANEIGTDMMYAAENVTTLQQRLSAPLLARIPYLQRIDIEGVANRFDVTPLMSSSAASL